MSEFRLRQLWTSPGDADGPLWDEVDRERFQEIAGLIRVVRGVVMGAGVVRFLLAPTVGAREPSLNPWLMTVGISALLLTANFISRRSEGQALSKLVLAAKMELVLDSAAVIFFIGEMAYGGGKYGFPMLLFPVCGAAARFGLRASAVTWLGISISYVVTEALVSAVANRQFVGGTLAWQLVSMALIGLLIGLLADVLMRQLKRSSRQEIEALRRADLLRVVADASRAMNNLGRSQLLMAARDVGAALGFDQVALFSSTYEGSWESEQVPDGAATEWIESLNELGLVQAVSAQRRTIALRLTADLDRSSDVLRASGFVFCIGIPIWVDGQVSDVLVALSSKHDEADSAEMECLELIAAQVASTLEAARHLEETSGWENRLAYEISHDRLTGLPNRAWFLEQLSGVVEDHVVSVLVCDLDRFKTINDSLGHHRGDQLIDAVAARLLELVGSQGMLARMGADEFAIQLKSVGSGDAVLFADRILEVFNRPFLLAGDELTITCSVGVASNEGPGSTDAGTLLRDANLAMYQAKRGGRARHELFGIDLRTRATRRMETETDLRKALFGGGLSVAYQPIVSLATGKVVSVEALARWNHPGYGPISPEDFIPIAEESGLIDELGKYVLYMACKEARAWQWALGEQAPCVSVNLSAVQLGNSECVDTVVEVLEISGIAPSQLVLEITESAVMADSPEVRNAVKALAGLGIRLAVDDFGKGWSSLAYLARYPLSELKIDGSFIAGMSHRESDRVIVASVVQLAHELGLEVVAEGIETSAQFDELTQLGCDAGQGFFLHRPLSPSAVSALFQTLVA